jgi:1,4-dihydroxy-2-naphthoate octaprenyltransferase
MINEIFKTLCTLVVLVVLGLIFYTGINFILQVEWIAVLDLLIGLACIFGAFGYTYAIYTEFLNKES